MWYPTIAQMLEHRAAPLAACAAFLLLIIGGMVNVTGSSLACPEAFVVCHKSILPAMTGGVLYEHGHRLAAMTVGTLQIVLTILIHRRRPELRWLGWLLLGMVLAQGLFGAITVYFKLVWFVSPGHLLLGMSYFAMLIYPAFRTRAAPSRPALRRLCVLAPILVATQITLGVFVVLSLRAVPLAVGHFAGAASLWALWMSAWLMTGRRQKKLAVDGELVAL